jgi:hypothetical protein
MPWDGFGNFTRTDGTRTGSAVWVDAFETPVKILADDHDTHDQDLADGIAACLAKNGENSASLIVMAGALKLEANQLRIDADEDTYLYASADDIVDLYINNERVLRVQNDASISSKMELRANEDTATQGPEYVAYRDSASPATADLIGRYRLDGEDSGGNQTVYGAIGGEIVDPTDASEEGQINFYVAVAGTLTEVATLGSAGLTLPLGGAAMGQVLGSEVATTSGTTVTFNSGLTSARKLTFYLNAVALDGAGSGVLKLQLGDSGGLETAGYAGLGTFLNSTGPAITDTPHDTYFALATTLSVASFYAVLVLERSNPAAATWALSGQIAGGGGSNHSLVTGFKTLSAALTQVQFQTDGTDVFSSGAISMLVET